MTFAIGSLFTNDDSLSAPSSFNTRSRAYNA
jgi:hypothetical protein